MLQALISILVIAILAGLFYWVLDQLGVPEPINRYAKIAVVFVAVIALIVVLTGIGGLTPGLSLR